MKHTNIFDPVKAVQTYLPLMHGFTIRSDLVARALTGNMELTAPFAREFAYLQFRRMCELIALGSVYIHGDLPGTQQKVFTKEWHAEKLMKLLHKHYAHAFPQPITKTQTPDGTLHIQANNKPNALTYSEFCRLYNECGGVLHRGTTSNVHLSSACSQEEFNKTASWHSKLVTLMDQHSFVSSNNRRLYVFTLRTQESGYPSASICDISENKEISEHIYNMTVDDNYLNSYISNTPTTPRKSDNHN